MGTNKTFKRYIVSYPGHNTLWANIILHIAVAVLLAGGVLAGVHRILILQTTMGIIEAAIFGTLLLALPLGYPALAWAAYTVGNIALGMYRGAEEGVMDAYHIIKGDLVIDNPEEDHFLKKLNRIEKPGEARKETVREVPYEVLVPVPGETIIVKEEVEKVIEVERPIPKGITDEEKIRYGIRIYIWKHLQEFLLPMEMQNLYESIIAMRNKEFDRIVPITSASGLTKLNAESVSMDKNDLYSLADNLCCMMRLNAKKSYEVFAKLFPNIYGKMKRITLEKAMSKDNRYDKNGKQLDNKIIEHFNEQRRKNTDAYMLSLYEKKMKKENTTSE